MSDAPLTLHWARHGESGPAVILLHGFANSNAWWLPWALPLSRDFRIFAPDLPGHGNSQNVPPPGPDLMAEISDSIARFIETEKLTDVSLVGFSFGAYLGQYLLLRHPHLPITRFMNVEHPPWTLGEFGLSPQVLEAFAAVVNAVGDDEQLVLRPANELPEELQRLYVHAIVRVAEQSLSSQSATRLIELVSSAGIVRRWILTQVSWPWGYRLMRAYVRGEYDLRERLPEIARPTWVIGTRETSIFAGDPLPFMQSRLPNAHAHYFEGASHAFLFRHPLLFHHLLSDFLAS